RVSAEHLSSEKIAFALRPGIFSPKEIGEISTVLDKNSKVTRIFIPDIRSGFESLDVVSSILAVTTRVHAGSGVIRLLEHYPALLTRRVQILQSFSCHRFFLEMATGLIAAVKAQMVSPIEFACYLKIFYSSQSDENALRLLLQEFLNYDSMPQYHEMFLQDGTAKAISEIKQSDHWNSGSVEVPK